MINGWCFTNVDKARDKIFPKKFVAVPRVGDYVESEDGFRMKVASICHKDSAIYGPHVKIELSSLTEMLVEKR